MLQPLVHQQNNRNSILAYILDYLYHFLVLLLIHNTISRNNKVHVNVIKMHGTIFHRYWAIGNHRELSQINVSCCHPHAMSIYDSNQLSKAFNYCLYHANTPQNHPWHDCTTLSDVWSWGWYSVGTLRRKPRFRSIIPPFRWTRLPANRKWDFNFSLTNHSQNGKLTIVFRSTDSITNKKSK